MIRPLLSKIKPVTGFAYLLHLGLLLLLPLIVFVLVRLNFVVLALIIIVLSKWRMFAVRPRFWPANIRANAVWPALSVNWSGHCRGCEMVAVRRRQYPPYFRPADLAS